MAKVKPPIVPEQPVPIVPEEGLQRLLAACAGKTFDARRDTAIVMFLLDTGARRAELAGLRRPVSQGSTPISCATRSRTPGWPRVAARPT
jgi:integrase